MDPTEDLSVEECKKLLVRLCANTDRGKSADEDTAGLIEACVRSLEAVNPTRDPAIAPGLSGKWSLVFTGASAADAARRAELEGALGSTLTEVTGSSGNVALATYLQSGDADRAKAAANANGSAPLGRTIGTLKGAIENKGNFQDIDAATRAVVNRAELEVFGTPVEVRIEASCVPAEANAAGERVRSAVAFRSVRFSVGKGADPFAFAIPLGWINDGKGPEGWLDTTYLDEDMRLGRGDKGSVFVTVRRKE